MLFDAAVLGLFAGLLTGGSLKRLLEMPLRYLPLLIGSVLLSQLPRITFAASGISRLGTAGAICFALIRYGLLFGFVAANRRCIPVDVIGAGGALNFLVTLANDGRMPVIYAAIAKSPHAAENLLLGHGQVLIYTVADTRTRLALLCDRLDIPFFDWTLQHVHYFLSVGDVLIAVGLFLLIIDLMKPARILKLLRS